jgi:hypothetical protein
MHWFVGGSLLLLWSCYHGREYNGTFEASKKVHQFETQELAYLLVCSGADEGRRSLIYTDTHTRRPNDGSHCTPPPPAAAP